MASARSLNDGLTTSEVPQLRTSYTGKGRGKASRGKNTNNSADTADKKRATDNDTDKEANERMSTAAVVEKTDVDSAFKAESNIVELLKMTCFSNADGIKALQPEDECRILEKVLESIATAEDLKNLVSNIYNWTLLDPAWTSCVASLCATLAKFEKDGVVFRSALLNHIRGDFESRDRIKADQPTRWLAFVCLLCDLFAMMKTHTNEYINVLIEPVYTCLQLLVSDKNSSDEQLKYATLKLKQLGKILQRSNPNKMDILMDSMRNRFLGVGVTAESRLLLLETIELFAGGWVFDQSTAMAYAELQGSTK